MKTPEYDMKPNTLGKFFYWLLKTAICSIVGAIWLKKISGLEKVPKAGPYVLIPNHASFLDFMILIRALCDRGHHTFFIKKKYFDKWTWKIFLVVMKQIRADEFSILKAQSAVDQGLRLVLFAEGKRTRTGEVGDAYPGLDKIAKQNPKVPIIPVALKNTFYVWPFRKKLPSVEKIVVVKFGSPVYFNDCLRCFQKCPENFGQRVMKIIRGMLRI